VDIPIQNVYYLLCYAWDRLEERDIVNVDADGSADVLNLLASVLVSGTTHLRKRGLDRGYVLHHEWTGNLRGRIDFTGALQRGRITAMLPCEFDELSHDVLHNRILKSTLRVLLRAEGLTPKTDDAVAAIYRTLGGIGEVELSPSVFDRVQLHRNNQFYGFLLKVCELVLRNLLPAERGEPLKFRDFLRDERQMRVLYENFIRNFYDRESRFEVKRDGLGWRWKPVDENSRRLLPKMQTDATLTYGTRRIIVECKFTPEATQRHYEAEKLRSGHLYQLHAYLENLTGPNVETCEAMLLYPSTGTDLRAEFIDGRRRISVRTINLNQPWPAIHRDLLELVA